MGVDDGPCGIEDERGRNTASLEHGGHALADFNSDGSVDVLDLIDLLLAFGQACP